jgi:cell division FtsZ-interacting protein ZapD
LCDDNGYLLYELKRNLTKEIAKFRMADIECALYQDLQEQEKKFSLKVRITNLDREKEIQNNLIQSVAKMHNALSNMKHIENTIKDMDPNFKSPIDYNFFRIKTKS